MTSRIWCGLGAAGLSQAITFANGILLVPLYLAAWGGTRYGEWVTLSAAVGCLSLLDLGMQSYVTNRICQAYLRGDLAAVHRDLHSALKIAYGLPGLVFVGAVAATLWLPLEMIASVRETATHEARIALVLLSANTLLLAIPQGVVGGLYRATGAYARGAMIGNAFRVIQLLGSVVLLLAGGSMAVLAGASFVVCAASGVVLWRDLGRLRPEISLGVRRGSVRDGASLVGPSLLFCAIGIAGTVNVQGTVLVVSVTLGGAAVAQFVTLRALSSLLSQAVGVVGAVSWPELTVLQAGTDAARLREFWRLFVKMSVLLAIVAALFVQVLGPDFYRLWTGRQLQFDETLLSVFLAQAVLAAFWTSAGLPLLASNRHWRYTGLMLADAGVTIVLAVFLVTPYGALGVAVASLIGDVVCASIFVPWLSCRLIGESMKALLGRILLPGAVIGLLVALASNELRPVFEGSALRLVAMPVVLLALYSVAVYVVCIDARERGILRRAGRNLFALGTR